MNDLSNETKDAASELSPTPHPFAVAFRRYGRVLWPAFIVAGIANMVFFALVDPESLGEISFPNASFSRELGYTIGFFMFFAVTATSSFLTAVLFDSDSSTRDSGA